MGIFILIMLSIILLVIAWVRKNPDIAFLGVSLVLTSIGMIWINIQDTKKQNDVSTTIILSPPEEWSCINDTTEMIGWRGGDTVYIGFKH